MKSHAVFKKTFNNMLDELAGHQTRSTLASEAQLADSLNVSRTTVRKALSELDRRKLVSVDEKERNLVAIHEHLDYIAALFTRNPDRIETACRRHLKSARKTLLASVA